MIGLIVQAALLVGWYTIPAMAAVPAVVIFFPSIMMLGILVFYLLLFIVATSDD